MSSQNQPAKGSAEEMRTAHLWLERVSEELNLDPTLTRAMIKDLLDLTRDVAHGPSRPAAPITAFLIGLAAGRAGAHSPEEIREHIAVVNSLLEELYP